MKKTATTDSWATFFKSFQRVHQKMEDHLKLCQLPDLEVYDILWTLEKSENQRLRFHDLASKVYLARFNLTRLCQKLETQGYIKKAKCPEDARGLYAHITVKGIRLRKKIWDQYKIKIDEHYSSKLSASDHKAMIRILSKLKIE